MHRAEEAKRPLPARAPATAAGIQLRVGHRAAATVQCGFEKKKARVFARPLAGVLLLPLLLRNASCKVTEVDILRCIGVRGVYSGREGVEWTLRSVMILRKGHISWMLIREATFSSEN